MLSKDESKKLEGIILSYTDELVLRYYVADKPKINKTDNIDLGYRQETLAEKKGNVLDPDKKSHQ